MNESSDPNKTRINPFQEFSRMQRTPINSTQPNYNTLINFNQPSGVDNEIYTSTPTNRVTVFRGLLDFKQQNQSKIEIDKTPLVPTQINQETRN